LNGRHFGHRQLLIGQETKEDLKSSAVRFEGVAGETSLGLEYQPSAAELMGGDDRKGLPTDRLNNEVD
jgi:hypothetical protein